HNLRASRQTELAEHFPEHVVCAWIGNSREIARRHYLQVRSEDFDRALKLIAPEAVQNPVQSPSPSVPAGTPRTNEKVDGEAESSSPYASVSPCKSRGWALQDSNLRPYGCDPYALAN